ncbi:DNA translocase FtsK [Bacillus nitratireducens]|uniref:DNA translocase FtsK n=1 Tax=Bacillus nitratireducens TaxID=2026193 RepID=A0ABU6PJS4_9BACI|nr:DNA translocase FtsK [Bacillus nitratireducens]
MLDWMKKLFNKEEEKTVMNKEVPAQIESQPKIPRVNHYTEAREAQMASRNAGKCRFPLIPDNGFDEEDVREIEHFEERPVQVVTYEEPSAQSGIKVERSRRLYVEKAVPTYEEPELQYEQEQEPIVKKASVPSKESNRRPFRPTEMISPIYGYNRPSVEKKVVQEEEKEREDLEISIEGTSVVDAWLEKKGYTLSDFSAGKKEGSSNKEELNEQTQKNSEVKEKSVVDAWLEKNGYEVESQVPSLEKSQSDQLLHKTVGQLEEEDTTVQALQQEQDVVELSNKENNEETLQEESIDSKVENVETILREEIECSTEIEETVAEVVANQVEEESSEDVVIVTTDEKLQETITIEIPDAFEEELEEATEEAAEEVVELEATEEAIEEVVELEKSEEATEEVVELEKPEEATEEVAELEEAKEATEEVAELEEAKEAAEEVVELEEATEEAAEEVVELEATEEATEEVVELEKSEEAAEEVAKLEGTKEEEPISQETVIEETMNTDLVENTPVAGQPVISQQETITFKEESEVFVPISETDEQTKKDVQNFANVLIEEAEEKKQVAEEQPALQIEEPKREKKRHVPFNVVMLKQDRKKLMERHAARTNVMQSTASERVEEKPVQQVVVEPQVEEKPVQQVVVEPQVEEKPMQQVVLEPQVEEKPMQQVVVEPQVEEKPVQQMVVEPQVEEKPVQQMVVEPQVEEKPVQQMVVEPQVEESPVQQMVVEPQMEEKPMQQVVVEPQVEGKPMQQVVVEPQVEEKPMQQVVVKQVQEPISSTEVQEKAYVVNQRENDMRNVLQTPPTYAIPPLTLLSVPQQAALDNTEWLEEQKELLNTTFNNFHVGAHVINVSQGPAVTRFEVQPDPGVKVNKITNLSDDIKLSLAAKDIRIEAPIPGKSAIGIEVPNKESKPVFLREILRSPVFTKSESPLTVALGLDISGDPIVTDIRKMPHGLIAGATGSGKSVCINAILTSILYKAKPHEVKLMLIDPKMVELAPYNSVPHLVAPVITDVKAATAALKWAVEEMERRYELFAHAGARDLTRYNTIVSGREIPGETLPYIVIVIDELADLMMVAPGDVEEAICRIAQKARACGIHLLVATQRPSVDVITGLIKSNIPTRIAFTVSSQVDSRTIIDIGGAEKLLGRGDMLFLGNGTSKPVRVQGVYVSDDEIEKTVDHVRKQMKPNYLFKQEDLLAKTEQAESEDELFFDACQFVVEQGGASTSSVQRKFRIGYNRAARLIEEMESQGIISEGRGTKPRDVLISEDEFAAMQETNV